MQQTQWRPEPRHRTPRQELPKRNRSLNSWRRKFLGSLFKNSAPRRRLENHREGCQKRRARRGENQLAEVLVVSLKKRGRYFEQSTRIAGLHCVRLIHDVNGHHRLLLNFFDRNPGLNLAFAQQGRPVADDLCRFGPPAGETGHARRSAGHQGHNLHSESIQF